MWWVRCALEVPAGCGHSGNGSLYLDVPDDVMLDPFALSVTEVTLTAADDGETVFIQTRALPDPGEAVDFGRVPLGEAMSFTLSGVT